jgi:hypothetical protein
MNTAVVTTAFLLLGVTIGVAQDWERAFREIRRLRPSEFDALPSAVRGDLERRGCRIPQTYAGQTPHNVIRGRFTSPANTDIAVLCSDGQSSRILVFGNGATTQVKEVAVAQDRTYLQVIGPADAVGYSRAIGVARMTALQRSAEALDEPKTPRIDHDGIDDAFIEKGSEVWYWSGARWIRLRGAD